MEQIQQILVVVGFFQLFCCMFDVVVVQLVVMLVDFFQIGDFKVLVFFDGLYEYVGFDQVIVGVGVQSGKVVFKQFDG